jgi:serine/threonine-protein kinase HipA
MNERLEVHVDFAGQTLLAGSAHFRQRGRRLTTTFTYDIGYLSTPSSFPLDPALGFDARGGTTIGLPGAFADSAPDRWGRRLITRRIQAMESGTTRSIGELDYLLGVSDLTRQGALRFRVPGQRHFAHPDSNVPKLVRLPELMHAADKVARDDDDLEAIKILLGAGAGTLGGARPKASVLGDDGSLYIAKFPHHNDEWDVMAWEMTALDLAERAGIDAPRRFLTQVSGRSVLLLKRFDRDAGLRVPYMSAMTLIQGSDGGDHDYLDLAGELMDVSAAARADLEELWRRIAFSVAIHNTDDHMRNHGLLRRGAGWRLSPVFDINPNPNLAEPRATAIDGVVDRAAEAAALREVASTFGISDRQTEAILSEVSSAASGWRDQAARNGVSLQEMARFTESLDGIPPTLSRHT